MFAYAEEIAAWFDRSGERPSCSRQHRVPGLLVLPFEYRASVAEHAFVGEGLAQELIARLTAASLASVRIVSWTTARSCAARGKYASELADELDVRYVVEGTVTAALQRWTIDVRIVDALEDRVLLVERFACGGREIQALQSTIAAAVAAHLALHLCGDLYEPAWTRATDPRAFLAMLDGIRKGSRGTDDASGAALASFDEALAIDPGLVPARACKGLALLQADSHRAWLRADVQAEVRALADLCAAEGPGLVTTAMLEAMIGRNDCAWERTDRRLSRALGEHPSSVAVRMQLAQCFTVRRRFAEASATLAPVEGLERSLEADKSIAAARLWSRDFEGAIERFDAMLASEPGHVYAGMMRFMAAIYRGDVDAARAYRAAMSTALYAKYASFVDGCVAAVAEDRAVARACRAEVADAAAASRLAWYHVAMLDGLVGDANGAAQNLAQSFARHEATCSLGAVDPSFDRVRSDAGFRAVVRRMGLPE